MLTYNEDLDTGSEPAAAAFTVQVDGADGPTVSDVSVSGMQVTLTLATAVGVHGYQRDGELRGALIEPGAGRIGHRRVEPCRRGGDEQHDRHLHRPPLVGDDDCRRSIPWREGCGSVLFGALLYEPLTVF